MQAGKLKIAFFGAGRWCRRLLEDNDIPVEIIIDNGKNKKGFRSFEKRLKKYPYFYNHSSIVGNKVKFFRITNGNFIKLYDFLQFIINKIRRIKWKLNI